MKIDFENVGEKIFLIDSAVLKLSDQIVNTALISDRLFLHSNKRRRIECKELAICDHCGAPRDTLFEYFNTTKGTVRICHNCSFELGEKSFGKKDAFDYSVSGGSFESNRRKH